MQTTLVVASAKSRQRLPRFNIYKMNLSKSFILVFCLLALINQSVVQGDLSNEHEQQNADCLVEVAKLMATTDHQKKRDYEKINKYLLENVKTDDMKENMDAVLELLHTKKAWNPTLTIVDALEQLTSLNELVNRCDWEGFVSLFKNVRASGIESNSNWRKLSRIDNLVLRYAIKHSDNCYKVYPAQYKVKLAKLDKQTVQRVDTFTEGFLMRYSNWRTLYSARSKINVLMDKFILKTESLDEQRDGRIAHEALKKLAKDDTKFEYFQYVLNEEKGMFELREDKIRELFSEYLLEPCKKYAQELGPDVFIPANYDALYKLNFDLGEIEYHQSWARFRICSILIEYDYESLLKQLISVVSLTLGEKPTLPLPPQPNLTSDQTTQA